LSTLRDRVLANNAASNISASVIAVCVITAIISPNERLYAPYLFDLFFKKILPALCYSGCA
jgi:hypothetical protein